MKIGTRSILYGAHAFYLHPWFVALAWWKLYGFPYDPRLWIAFFVHDLGYWGKPNMDGPEGETHPELGSKIMARMFGPKWGEFTLLHSRWYSNRLGKRYSKLCVVDKYAICLTPSIIYLPMVWATGELEEYMGCRRENKYTELGFDESTPYKWHQSVKEYIRGWVMLHKDVDKPDMWMINGADLGAKPMPKLAGYLEGGFEADRYTVTKTRGETDPDAKYFPLRFDKLEDPNAIFAIIAYAASVDAENTVLARELLDALAFEMGMDYNTFMSQHSPTFLQLVTLARNFK